jgi:hypothetical protein
MLLEGPPGISSAAGAAVVILIIVLPLPRTEAGLNWQLLMDGKREHEKLTVPLKPSSGLIVRIKLPAPPGLVIVIKLELAVKE